MLKRAVVLLINSLTVIFFRAQTMSDAMQIVGKMFTDFGFSMNYFSTIFSVLKMDVLGFVQIVVSLIILYKGYEMCYPTDGSLFSKQAQSRTASILRLNTYVYYILLIAIIWIMAASGNMTSQFIYFQF